MKDFSLAGYQFKGKAKLHYNYFLKSISHPAKSYSGITHDLARRLYEHNAGMGEYTSRYTPWTLSAYVMTDTEETARVTEQYFKNASFKERVKRKTGNENDYRSYFDSLEIGEGFGSGDNRFVIQSFIKIPVFVLQNPDAVQLNIPRGYIYSPAG